MRKLYVISIFVLALTSCAKNELFFTSEECQEITFNVAPRTKGDDENNGLDSKYHFTTYAYQLGSGKNWADDHNEAQLVIDGADIYEDREGDLWRDPTTTHYWPSGDASLSFFSYTFQNNANPTPIDGTVECVNTTSEYGIKVTNFDFTKNQFSDFLVADIAADKTGPSANNPGNGVPTLFRHKLVRMEFYGEMADNYPGVSIGIDRITVNNIYTIANYIQYPEKWSGHRQIGNWEASSSVFTIRYGSPQRIYTVGFILPQTVPTNAEIQVNYSITYPVEEYTLATEDCVTTINLSEILPELILGKRYTIKLKFSLEELVFEPTVQDWEGIYSTAG